MELTRKDILSGGYEYPTDLIHLVQTKHAVERMLDRMEGIIVVPEYVRVTKDNIHSGRSYNGKTLCSVVVKLNYSYRKDLYLCLNPYDGGLKTLWLKDKKRRHYGTRNNNQQSTDKGNSEQTVQDDKGGAAGGETT